MSTRQNRSWALKACFRPFGIENRSKTLTQAGALDLRLYVRALNIKPLSILKRLLPIPWPCHSHTNQVLVLPLYCSSITITIFCKEAVALLCNSRQSCRDIHFIVFIWNWNDLLQRTRPSLDLKLYLDLCLNQSIESRSRSLQHTYSQTAHLFLNLWS